MGYQPLFNLRDFDLAPGITHVCAAGESLPLRSNKIALEKYMVDKTGGHKGRENQTAVIDSTRESIAKSWNVSAKETGFVSSVAEGVCLLLESLDWSEEDNVCVDADEYPSLVATFAVKNQRSKESSTQKAPQMRYFESGTANTVVDKNTRLIAVSYVSYLNAARNNLATYRALADSVGAILLVDFTQAAGYIPVNASIADFAFSACYKWLLGTTGAAIAFWNQKRQPSWKPATAGWHSLSMGTARHRWGADYISVRDDAMCFSRGNPGHLSIYILSNSLKYLSQWSACDIQQHVQILTTKLIDELEKAGIKISTPKEPQYLGASVTIDCAGASRIVDDLFEAGIYAWNGRGRVRFSFHGYNSINDVNRIMEVFPGLWKECN